MAKHVRHTPLRDQPNLFIFPLTKQLLSPAGHTQSTTGNIDTMNATFTRKHIKTGHPFTALLPQCFQILLVNAEMTKTCFLSILLTSGINLENPGGFNSPGTV